MLACQAGAPRPTNEPFSLKVWAALIWLIPGVGESKCMRSFFLTAWAVHRGVWVSLVLALWSTWTPVAASGLVAVQLVGS